MVHNLEIMKIGNREIGANKAPLVIAEIGINHGGKYEVAKEMVLSAYRAGAEIVKFQTHIVEDEMTDEAKSVVPGNADVSIYKIMEDCSLTEKEEYDLKDYVESLGMIYMSSAFSRAAADRLRSMAVKAIKIGSGECNNYPLLEHVASFGIPVILSTGMNDLKSIGKAVDIFRRHQCELALMHTTNLYPTVPSQVRLGAMMEMHEAFKDLPFGLSDHTLDNTACLGAVALGASILERHFTDHKYRKGPDIICSMDEVELKCLIRDSKNLFQMRGGQKSPLKEEKVTIDFAYASVCAIKDISKGEILSTENIWVKRPGTGDFLAESYDSLLGKTASKNIKANTQINTDDIL